MAGNALEALPRETLIKLIKVYSRNWQTLDGLWFRNVESSLGLEAAVEVDLQNWREQAVIEASRLKEALELEEGGITSVLTVLSFMSWQLTSPLFEYEIDTPSRAIICYRRCAVQEGRRKASKPVFPCREMKETLLSGIARVIDPAVKIRCLSCPPDEPGTDCWCRWELNL